MINMTIRIDQIRRITETNNPLSAPATSLDRLAISYNNGDTVLISPKDKSAFINDLVRVNSNIEVVFKKKGQLMIKVFIVKKQK